MGAAAAHPTDQTLEAYGLGKLDDSLAESVSKHLEVCPSCQIRVADLSSDDFLGRLRMARIRRGFGYRRLAIRWPIHRPQPGRSDRAAGGRHLTAWAGGSSRLRDCP